MEHRLGRRKAVALSVRLRGSPGAIGFGSLRDLSLSGAYVRTNLRAPLLGCVAVIVENDEIPAQVVRRDGRGLGLEWEDFAPPAVGRLLGHSDPHETSPAPASTHRVGQPTRRAGYS